ncbi:rhodanese-like domain-containing protein [Sphingobacterium sp. HJSM2_6]|uniref:rhodanese-like domain-containing protein n=1 Tax=Sphingobacterium sp. HJSM2_6 TaxID=3366264 RepID=UPI003BC221AD
MKKLFCSLCFSCLAILSFAQQKISADELDKLVQKGQIQLLDVRTPKEYNEGHIERATNTDWKDQSEFKASLKNLNKAKPVYVYCLAGGRSKQAADYLVQQGFEVYEYVGGMMEWKNTDHKVIKNVSTENVESLSLEQFDHLIQSKTPVLVVYSAVWCVPCQEMKPSIDNVEKKLGNKLKVVRIDADKNAGLLKLKKIKGIPKLALYKNGRESWTKTGVVSESTLLSQIAKLIPIN